ncbi:MAG: SIS domain-containing protein [Planctomycetota bacterium]|nr:SIS domain-containing protein [Planctomycetota bacterium]
MSSDKRDLQPGTQDARRDRPQGFAEQSDELRAALTDIDGWHERIGEVVQRLRTAFAAARTVFVAGNGGSATLAQHLADEMVGRYRSDRRPYPVVALTADSAVLTCIANDYGFEQVFARQIEALGRRDDVFIAFSTSGNSDNILAACRQAKDQGLTVIGFSGPEGQLKDVADMAVVSPAASTARVQEMDLHAIHLICEAFESP